MARIRTIKPAFFKHEELFDLEDATGLPIRIAFAGLWTIADREGRFKWRARSIKADVLPFDDLDFEDVLGALESAGFLIKYEVDGEFFGCIPSFSEHQRVNQREAESELPSPEHARTCKHVTARGEQEGKGTGREGVNLPAEDTPISEAVEIYKSIACECGLPMPRQTQRVRANLSKVLNAYDIGTWREACEKIRGSPFLRGENDRGWQVTLGWLAEKSKFEKVIEGRYDGTNGSGNRKRSGASSHIAALGEWAGEEDSGSGETPQTPRLERGNRDPGGTTSLAQGAGGTVLDGDFQVLSTGDTKASGGGFG